jgi:hypothetical protein
MSLLPRAALRRDREQVYVTVTCSILPSLLQNKSCCKIIAIMNIRHVQYTYPDNWL